MRPGLMLRAAAGVLIPTVLMPAVLMPTRLMSTIMRAWVAGQNRGNTQRQWRRDHQDQSGKQQTKTEAKTAHIRS